MKALENFAILIICAFTISCSQPTASTQIPNSTNDGSAIKTIETYNVNPQTDDKDHVSTEHYDDLGNMVNSLNYNSYPNDDTQEKNCTYAVNGNMKCITTDPDGKQVYFYEKIYEGKNVVEEKSTYATVKYTYDKNGNVILEEEFDSDGKFFSAEKYELIYNKGTTELQSKTTFQKNGNGEFKKYDKTYYTFDEGKLQEEISNSIMGRYEYHYQYFSNRNVKEKITLQGVNEKVITKYHENGKRSIETIFRRDNADDEMTAVQINKWTYDKHHNEVMFEAFRNDKLTKKRIQEITYY